MGQDNNFEDRLNGSGINIAITPEVSADQHISIIKMLMCQVARVAGRLTGGDVHAMTRKYIQLLMAVKELGLLDTTRLAGCFELTTGEVALLVDRLVIEPSMDDCPAEPHVLEAKMALNMVAHTAYSATLIMALPMVSPELSRLVADITDPIPVYHPVLPNANKPAHNAIPHLSVLDPLESWRETSLTDLVAAEDSPTVTLSRDVYLTAPSAPTSGSGGVTDHSTRDLIVGTVVIAAVAIAAYHGVKYLMGDSLDAPVLSDLDTTL